MVNGAHVSRNDRNMRVVFTVGLIKKAVEKWGMGDILQSPRFDFSILGYGSTSFRVKLYLSALFSRADGMDEWGIMEFKHSVFAPPYDPDSHDKLSRVVYMALTHWIGDECQGRVGKASHNDFQIAIFLKFDDEPPHQNAHSCVLGGAADGLSVRHIPLFKDTPIRDFWWNLSAARSHGLSIESVVNDLAERAFPGGSEGKVSTRVETIRKLARSGLRV